MKALKLLLPFVILSVAALFIPMQEVLASPPEMVTICHAAGLEGTTQYVTLTLAYPAVYGPAGHFYENGTPRAGHEQDYLGACTEVPSATSTLETTPTSTLEASPTEEPTATPTSTPTDEQPPTSTVEPSPTVGTTPTVRCEGSGCRPLPTDDCIPGGGTEFAPCETREPTPKGKCEPKVVGFLWHLEGPNGQEADFASFSPREGGGWYLPNVSSQQTCLGWVAVNAPFGKEIVRGCDGTYSVSLIRCEGGAPCASIYDG